MTIRPVMLVILDGFGWREDSADNAVRQAKTPTFTGLWESGPHAFLRTSGRDVGLPDGQMGNSEVGHLNIGAGRVVMQDLPRIDKAIASGELARNTELTGFIDKLKKTGGSCQLMGLLSPGGVHAHQDHIVALAKIIDGAGVPVFLHAFLDGRDTPPSSAKNYVAQVVNALKGTKVKFATIGGRYFAMDRDKRWDRVEQAYDLLTSGTAAFHATTACEGLQAAYARDENDEFVKPTVIGEAVSLEAGDAVLFMNFRADRAR